MTESPIPQHVAIIPDGNRRWATAQGLAASLGHQEGTQRFWEISEALFKSGVSHVTLWGASNDNLTKRNRLEIQFLVGLAKQHLANPKLIQQFVDNGIRVRIVGKWNDILHDAGFAEAVARVQTQTEHFTERTLTILFGYDGVDEMLDAIGHTATQVPSTYESVKQQLATGFLPEVDLVIRTGGEPHWSAGFMMWLTRNSQFYFTETLWPAFNEQQLELALADFAGRERRMGT